MMSESEYINRDIEDDEVIDTVRKHIAEERALSLARFGDGEVSFFCGEDSSYPPFTRHFKKRICLRYGYHFPKDFPKARSEIFEVVKEAISKSDMFGIAHPNEEKQCHLYESIKQNPSRWRFTKSLAKELGYVEGKQRIFDQLIVRKKKFGSLNAFKEILQGKPLHVITPFSKLLESRNLASILKTQISYTYAPKKTTLDYWRTWAAEEYHTIKAKVIVFGLSNAGKSVGALLSEKLGAVCIDFGAVLAAWAGQPPKSHIINEDAKYLCPRYL